MKRLLVLTFMFALFHSATQAQVSENKAKAIFIYSIAKYVGWENLDGEFNIGVYGNSPITSILQQDLSSRKILGNPVVAEKVKGENLNSLEILFVPSGSNANISQLAAACRANNTMLVSEDDLSSEGAYISFVKRNSKLSFVINKASIEQANLKVMSSLYNLGEVI